MPNYISTIDTPDGSSYSIRPTAESLSTIGITPSNNILYGTSDTSTDITPKIVTLDINDATVTEGTCLVIQPDKDTTVYNNLSIGIAGQGRSYGIIYNDHAISDLYTAQLVWNKAYPSIFLMKEAHWVYLGSGGGVLPLKGGTMYGAINMGDNTIIHLGAGYTDDSAVRRDQVLLYDPRTNTYTANGCIIEDVDMPVNSTDAANKKYVDNTVSDAIQENCATSILQGVDITSIDGRKDFNIASYYYIERGYPTLDFAVNMLPNSVCHIIAYRRTDSSADSTSYSSGTMRIPNNICVGGQPDSSNNYVWINGNLTNGSNVSGSGLFSMFTTTAKGMLEISILFTTFGNHYRTIIKVDKESDY